MASKIDEKKLREILGDPKVVSEQLESFRASTDLLSTEHPRMIDQYPKQWVAIYNRSVVAHADSMGELFSALDAGGIPRQNVVIRFIDRDKKTMIL